MATERYAGSCIAGVETAVCNEFTKLHESAHWGSLSELSANFEEEPRREYVVVIRKRSESYVNLTNLIKQVGSWIISF